LQAALLDAGAVPRMVAARLGTVTAADGLQLEPDATMENSPGFLFDALVLPDGQAAAEALAAVGHTMDVIKDQYRHCKTILALGASQALLGEAGIPLTLPDGAADPGLILADSADIAGATVDFIAAVGMHRHTARDSDPPRV
ncbi:MAG: DJ-1/PfpI family protein, partial [Variovorax sp.]